MIREVNLDEISDGKRYSANDLVKADCNDCKGCFECCCDMGSSIILDPYDIAMLSAGLGQSFDQLLQGKIELNLVDGLILPNLVMSKRAQATVMSQMYQNQEDKLKDVPKCNFLNKNGRCSIHSFRPGICRLFPLGRVYENHSFQYFLQTQECMKNNRTKIKVKKWIGIPDLKKYEQFVLDWHTMIQEFQKKFGNEPSTDQIRDNNLFLLKTFFQTPYKKEKDFYDQFYERFQNAKQIL